MNDLHIDVEWLMENPWFQSNVTLVAGSSGLKRRVTYVTVQEAPDFYKQIEGGEFVLSTWYAFKDDLHSGLKALEQLSSKVSAICIKINRFIHDIPQEYIDYADAHGVPLFFVDKDIKFREIIKNITLEISSVQTSILIQLKNYYQYLFTSALNNGSAESMLLDFSKRTGLIAITLSADFSQMRGMRTFNKLPNSEERLQTIRHIVTTTPNQGDYFQNDEYHIFPCIARGYCYGYLIILNQGILSESVRLFVIQLCNIITIKWLDRQENENEKLLRFLSMIRSPKENIQYIESYLNNKSIDYTSGLSVIQLKIRKIIRRAPKINLAIMQNFLMDLVAIKHNVLYIWDKANSFTILVDDMGLAHKRKKFIEQLHVLCNKHTDVSVSVGTVVDNILNIKDSLRVSINTMLFIHPGANFIDYNQAVMELAILGGVTSYECDIFISMTIMPIIEHDHTFKDYVFQTLSLVIDNNSLEVAAHKEKVHVNTIRYRLQKIKNIINLDFFNNHDKHMIIVAYTMYKNRDLYQTI